MPLHYRPPILSPAAATRLQESKGVETTLKDYPKYNGKSLAHVYSVLFPFDEAGSEMIDGAIDFYREILSR